MEGNLDLTDFLIAVGIFATFVVFGVCMWLLRHELNKKRANQKEVIK